jgi:hypothetical protein
MKLNFYLKKKKKKKWQEKEHKAAYNKTKGISKVVVGSYLSRGS